MKRGMVRLGTIIAAIAVVSACASAPPESFEPRDPTADDVRVAVADATMVLVGSLLIVASEEEPSATGSATRGAMSVAWENADFQAGVGAFDVVVDDYVFQSDFFAGAYSGYRVSGSLSLEADGEVSAITMDLWLSHRRPDRYPVTSLQMALSGLDSQLVPINTSQVIVANGIEFPLADIAEGFQVGD